MPNETGDIRHDEYALMPRDLAVLNMTYTIDAYGDSMVGAGIDHGDRLEVLSTPVARHGDIVVASLEGGKTVKSFFIDDFGRQWLVPANRKYKPILITEERKVRIDELDQFAECGLCGTAAVISPVGKIVDHGKEICPR